MSSITCDWCQFCAVRNRRSLWYVICSDFFQCFNRYFEKGVKCIVNSCSADSALTSIHINGIEILFSCFVHAVIIRFTDNSIFSTGILVTLLSVIIVLSLCLQFDVLSTTLTLLKFKPLLLREL